MNSLTKWNPFRELEKSKSVEFPVWTHADAWFGGGDYDGQRMETFGRPR